MARLDDANKKDLNDGRAEALQALLSSLSPSSSTGANGGKLTTDQVRKLSDKLGQILGEVPESGEDARRNEKGELVNEEGLPIIDINEPVAGADYAFRPDPDSAFDDPDLLPLWTLSDEEKVRRKAERERILDLLEEEERVQQARDAENTRKRLQEEMEKRKEASRDEMDKLKKARELQKKLGKALIRSVVESRDQAEKEKAEQEEQDRLTAASRPLKPKKSVSFADEGPEEIRSPDSDSKGKGVDWGDVAPGTLRKPGPSDGRSDRPVMKMHVVERQPSGLRSPGPPARDSDDESDPESYGAQDTDDEDRDRYNAESDEEAPIGRHMHSSPPDSGDSEEEDHVVDEEPSEWNDEDFDTARHQREVALEYYEKRKTIGAEVVSAMRAHDHGVDNWDQPEVPLEATLASEPPKPSVSRFRAERHHDPPPNTGALPSHSLGAAVLPVASAASLQRAIRMGKLEDGKLVGGAEGDSGDEVTAEDESAQQLLEAILRGEVTNVGPQSSLPSTIQPAKANPPSPAAPSMPVDEPSVPTTKSKPSKVSKFKLALQQPHTMTGQISPSLSSAAGTPTNGLERSSPKLYAASDSPSDPPQGVSSVHPLPKLASTRSISGGSLPPPGIPARQMPSIIVESPSFRPPRVPNTPGSHQAQSLPPNAFHSVILDSPSFQPPTASSSPLSPSSTAVETPTSAPPTTAPSPSTPKAPTPLRSAVVERRPPTIASPGARELPAAASGSAVDGAVPKQKVSRFKAQRS